MSGNGNARVSIARTVHFVAAPLVLLVLVSLPLVAVAASPKKGAVYGGKVVLAESRDPGVQLKVSSRGTKLDFIGPADPCDPQGQIGASAFNPWLQFHPRIYGMKIARNGTFTGNHKYDWDPDGQGWYIFHWDVSVKGRFVSRDRARGSLTWQMTYTGKRMVPGSPPHDCGRNQINFTARRGVRALIGLTPYSGPER